MSSLLTNNSAMVALQTLKTINKNMGEVQNQISTGKRIANARDNAALWGISTTMKTDVSGFKAISESLSLGSATLSVARDASETIADLLDEMKGKVVAAQEENVDRFKIQADVDALRDQIRSVRGAAQFNGLNLIASSDTVNILSSLDRDSYGNVASSSIAVVSQDLSEDQAIFGGGTDLDAEVGLNAETAGNFTTDTGNLNNTARSNVLPTIAAVGNNETITLTIAGTAVSFTSDGSATAIEASVGLAAAVNAAGITGITATGTAANDFTIINARPFEDVDFTWSATTATLGGATSATATIKSRATEVSFDQRSVVAGDSFRITLGTSDRAVYTAKEGDTTNDVVKGLKIAVDALNLDDITTQVAVDSNGNDVLKIDKSTTGNLAIAVAGSTGGTVGGGLFGLQNVDVTTAENAAKALSNIEAFIQASISAAAAFGSTQGRIQTQSEFVSKIMDGLTSGIGTLVDADMEAASAKLQALQVQQQLGIQALSIANQSPQNILALFR